MHPPAMEAFMRVPWLLPLLLVALLASGCLRAHPTLNVRNETDLPASGTLRLYLDPSASGRLDEPRGEWTFDVAPGEQREIADLPRRPMEYHWLVVNLSDGRSTAGPVHNGAHFMPAHVRILPDRVEISQAVT